MNSPNDSKNSLRPLLEFCKGLLFLVFVVSPLGSPLRAQLGGGVAPSGSQVHLVRSVVGAKGEQHNGSFVMTEPRSAFYIPEDREVVVYFEWEGAKGNHHCEGTAYYSTGGTSVAASLLPQSIGSAPASLQDLWAKGEMISPVTGARYVLFGMLIQGPKDASKKKAPVVGERELKVSFRKSDTTAGALVHFTAPENLKSTSVIKLYDVDNHPVGTDKVDKLNLSRGESLERNWQLPLSTLPPGIYRVDVLVGDSVVWRQYFKLTN